MAIDLGVNIDHVATLRNARGERDPSLVELALLAQEGGADSFTMHLREDRRHIKDEDLNDVARHSKLPINFEMALTDEMVAIALQIKPRSVCIVPEKREEVTTEGGLNVELAKEKLLPAIKELQKQRIEVCLFIEPDEETIRLSHQLGADGVEIHTGSYAHAFKNRVDCASELERIFQAAKACADLRLRLHAGHGLNYVNIQNLLKITNLKEVNIGHALISYALNVGMVRAVRKMKRILTQ